MGLKSFGRKVKRTFLGSKADKQTEIEGKEEAKQIKQQAAEEAKKIRKKADVLSKYRDEVADLYDDLASFLKKLCKYDKNNFNVDAINKAIREVEEESGKKGKIDSRTKKDASSVSKSLYDENVRVINIQGIKVNKSEDGKIKNPTVGMIPVKLNFRNYFDMNGKSSRDLSYTRDFLRGMEPDVAVRKTVKLHAVCCIYMERMEQIINLFFTGHKKFKELRNYYNMMDKKLIKLTNEERRIIKSFSKNVHNEVTGEEEVETVSALEGKEPNEKVSITFTDGYTSEFLRKMQAIKDFVGGHAAIVDDRRYSRLCLRSTSRLENMYTGLTRRLGLSFEVMAKGGKGKNSEDLKKAIGYTELIQKIDKAFGELEELQNKVLDRELALKKELKRLDNKEKLRRYKNNIEKKIVLVKKGNKETDREYEERFKEIDKQRAKECVDLIELLGSIQSDLEDFDLKFGRKKRYLAGLLRKLDSLDDTPEFKTLMKESMEGAILGRGRSIQFNRNLGKELKSKKEQWDREDEQKNNKRKEKVKSIREEGEAEAKKEEKAAEEKAAAEKAAKEEEAKRKAAEKTAAANPPSDEAVPAGDSSSSSSADLPEGGAPSTEPLPEEQPDKMPSEVHVDT